MIRADLPVSLQQKSSVKWDEMPVGLRAKMWELFNAALKPANAANKLGVVIFQVKLGEKFSFSIVYLFAASSFTLDLAQYWRIGSMYWNVDGFWTRSIEWL